MSTIAAGLAELRNRGYGTGHGPVISMLSFVCLFSALGLVPAERTAKVAEQSIRWNYTTILNILFLLPAAALLVRFFRSGGRPMLQMMRGSPDDSAPDQASSGAASPSPQA